jgi:hypothetical protein
MLGSGSRLRSRWKSTVIERNGGVLEDERNGKLRFWAPTGSWGGRTDKGVEDAR